MRQTATLALAAWLCLVADGAMISKRGSSEGQMQYGGAATPSDTQETPTSTGPAWPVGPVPGMNIHDIFSYENGHNFELKPSQRRTTTSYSSSRLTPDLPHETLSTPIKSGSGTSPATTTAPSLNKRLEGILVGPGPNDNLGPDSIAYAAGVCKSDFIGDWIIKRDQQHTSIGPQGIVDRYLPYLNLRAAMKRREAARISQRALPYGVVEVRDQLTIYTDEAAYKQAVMTWYNARTGVDNVCGDATPPLLRVTTKKASPKTTKTTSANKMKNANGAVKFGKPKGGEVISIKRREGDGGEGEEADWSAGPAEVDAGTITAPPALADATGSPSPWTA